MADQIPDSAKLLPCPFCESADVSMSFSATLQSPEPAARFVECEDCTACGPSVKIVDGDDADAKASAAAAWNTRVTSPAGQEVARAAPPAMDREAMEITAEMLGEVMQDAWGEICDDAEAHPGDMVHGRGTVLHYRPSHWTSLIALRLNERLSTLSADAIRQGEVKYLVWSNEHRAWWGPDERGYTRVIEHAGRYDRDKAFSISSKRGGGWQREANPDEIAIPEADAIAQYTGPRLATPASHASDGGKA